ncbi:MAG TPA: zf-HC2 domain-containing protein [Bryobacteraceae bacterium]|nr:zf-HC2 domain-containing protein [Bryobacteraceae bacterium]
MRKPQHISNDVLVRFLDDESPAAEAAAVEQHLSVCAECKQKYHDFGGVSRSIESFVNGSSPRFSATERDELVLLLKTDLRPQARSQKELRHFAWGMALAASLAIGLILAPRFKNSGVDHSLGVQDVAQSASLLEVDGETFVPLPYSNPDLPVAAHHIVQMQVPVSSLADAGVHFEAISNEISSSNDSVIADVLLGIDGQPLGVHVLSVE